jgi:hypothetical protein
VWFGSMELNSKRCKGQRKPHTACNGYAKHGSKLRSLCIFVPYVTK